MNHNEDCCTSEYICGHNQGNCKTDADCQSGLTCESTCPHGFPDGYKCCHNSGKFFGPFFSILMLT